MNRKAHDNVLLHGIYLEAALCLAEIEDDIDDLLDRQKRYRKLLLNLLSVGENGVDKDNVAIVTVIAGATSFNPTLALQMLPQEMLLRICTSAPDPKKAKQYLSEAAYESCVEYNQASVVAL